MNTHDEHTHVQVSNAQFTSALRKLYHMLEDLKMDAPNAKAILTTFSNHAIIRKYLHPKDAEEMEDTAELLADTEVRTHVCICVYVYVLVYASDVYTCECANVCVCADFHVYALVLANGSREMNVIHPHLIIRRSQALRRSQACILILHARIIRC